MTGISLLCLASSIILLSRLLGWSLAEAAAFVLLSGYAVYNVLRFGQPYVLVSTSCILGYFAYRKGRPLLAGVCFGLFVPIKYFPVVILLYFLFRKEWKVVLGGAAAAAAVVLASIAVLGWQVHQQFLTSVLGQHLTAHLSMQDPFTASFQSFDTLFRRLFVFDAAANPHPWRVLPGLQGIAAAITKIAILAVAVVTLVKLARDAGADSVPPSIGLLGILVLLLAPATATYHFVLLWLPIGLLLGWLLRVRAPTHAALQLGLYSLIGFCPYGHTLPFEGRGGLTVLAYPTASAVRNVQHLWSISSGAGRNPPGRRQCTLEQVPQACWSIAQPAKIPRRPRNVAYPAGVIVGSFIYLYVNLFARLQTPFC